MCRVIKVIHFGCEDQHSEVVMVRCKAGLEYILNMPISEVCSGLVRVEDWVMSPCRFCAEYLESRKASCTLTTRARAVSLQENKSCETAKDAVLKSSAQDDMTLP